MEESTFLSPNEEVVEQNATPEFENAETAEVPNDASVATEQTTNTETAAAENMMAA